MCNKFLILNTVCSLGNLCKGCVKDKMLLKFCKNKNPAYTLRWKRTIYKRVENFRITGSAMKKNKLEKLFLQWRMVYYQREGKQPNITWCCTQFVNCFTTPHIVDRACKIMLSFFLGGGGERNTFRPLWYINPDTMTWGINWRRKCTTRSTPKGKTEGQFSVTHWPYFTTSAPMFVEKSFRKLLDLLSRLRSPLRDSCETGQAGRQETNRLY